MSSDLKGWLVMQSRDSKHSDVEGRAYEYLRQTSNAQRIAVGDILVVALPKPNSLDGRRIFGLGRVGAIQAQGTDRFIASYERYPKLSKSTSFDQIGGDSRRNQTNSINPINPEIVGKLLAREGVSGMECLPLIVSEPSRRNPPPSDDDLREMLHEEVGHGVSEQWEQSAGCVDLAVAVRTHVVPWYDMPVTKAAASARKTSIRRTNE